MRDRLRNFMMGRYGNDGLNRFLCGAALVSMVLSMFTRVNLFYWLAIGLLIWCYFRMFSRNTAKRYQENAAFYALRQKLGGGVQQKRLEWSQRAVYRYYRCPQCGQKLRVPKGRGRISITCPKCHTEFVKKS